MSSNDRKNNVRSDEEFASADEDQQIEILVKLLQLFVKKALLASSIL